jgi:glycosyltransferase involved in cell wall biosynthesis
MMKRTQYGSSRQSNFRVALLTNIPAPYRLPFFTELSDLCELTVLFDALSEPNRRWVWNGSDCRFTFKLLNGISIPYIRRRNVNERRFLQLSYNIIPQLFLMKPHVVVSAETGFRSLQASFYCRLKGIPLIIWWEGTQHTEGTSSRLKLFIRRYLVRRASRFWSNGRDSAALLQAYGADLERIDDGMTGIDTKALSLAIRNITPSRDTIRSNLHLKGVVLLFIGQIVARKGIPEYLAALDIVYRSGMRNWSAMFVGTGGLEADLQKWSNDHPEICVNIAGFVQPKELPSFLCAADVFVLPTLDDNWALAPLEALAAGIPQLFSVYNGSTADLLLPSITGRRVNPIKTEEFALTIKQWIESPPERLQSEQIAALLEYYSSEAMARRAIISLENAINTK